MEDTKTSGNSETLTKDTVPAPEHFKNGYQHESSTSFSTTPYDKDEVNSSKTRTGQDGEEQILVASLSETVIVEAAPIPENVIIETPNIETSENNGIEGMSISNKNSETAQFKEEVPSLSGSVIIEEVPVPENVIIESLNNGREGGLVNSETALPSYDEVLVTSPSGSVVIEEGSVPENVVVKTLVVENLDNNGRQEELSNFETAQLSHDEVLVSSPSGSVTIEEAPVPENVIVKTPVVENTDNNRSVEGLFNSETVQLSSDEVLVSSASASVIIEEVPVPENVIIETPVVAIIERAEGLLNSQTVQLSYDEVLVSSPSGSVIIEEVPVPENVIVKTPVVENLDNNGRQEGLTNSEIALLSHDEVLVSSPSGSVIIAEVPIPENVIVDTPVVETLENNGRQEELSNFETAQLSHDEVLVSSSSGSVIIEEAPVPENVIVKTPVVENSDNNRRVEGLFNSETVQLSSDEVLRPSASGSVIIEEVPVAENVIIETPVVAIIEKVEGLLNSQTAQLSYDEVLVSSPSGCVIIEAVPLPENVITKTPIVVNSENNGRVEGLLNYETAQLSYDEVLVSSPSGSIIIEEMPIPENVIIKTPVMENLDNNGRQEALSNSDTAQLSRDEVLVSSPSGSVIIEEVHIPENVIAETPVVENLDNNERQEGLLTSETAQLSHDEVVVSSSLGNVIVEEVPVPDTVIIKTPVVKSSDDNRSVEGLLNSETTQLSYDEVLVSLPSGSVIINEVPVPENIIVETPVVEITDNNGRGDGLLNSETAQLRNDGVLVSTLSGSNIIEEVPVPENVIIESPNNGGEEGLLNSETAQLSYNKVLVSSPIGSVVIKEVPAPENVIVETPVVENSDNNGRQEGLLNSETAQLSYDEVLVLSPSGSVIIEEVPVPENVIVKTPVVENSDNNGRVEGLFNYETAQLSYDEVLVSSASGSVIIEEVPVAENVIVETPVVEIIEREEGLLNSETAQLSYDEVLVSSPSGSVFIEEVPVPENVIIETLVVENSVNTGREEELLNSETAQLKNDEDLVSQLLHSVIIEDVPVSENLTIETSIIETPEIASFIIETPTEEYYMTRPVVAAINVETVVPVVELRNGITIPAIGFGTWEIEPDEAYHAVKNAINAGFRHIDCALIYQNESAVGPAIVDSIRDGVVRREDLFITSKLWNTFHKPNLVESSCRQTLADLGLDYLDLYLIQTPIGCKEGKQLIPKIAGVLQYSTTDYLETWYAMEDLVKKGLVRSIGLSNFNSQQVKRVVSRAKVWPVTNQVECHPLLNQNRLTDCCEELGLVLTAYSPLCIRGQLFDEPIVMSLSQKYGKTPAQILLRYQLDKGNVVVTRTVQPERMLEALAVTQFQLAGHDVMLLDSINRNKRYHAVLGESHKEYPFKIPF